MYRNRMFMPLMPVIKNLMIANALIFIAQETFKDKFPIDEWFALHHFLGKDFKPHQLLTYMFMHASWGHLFGNMLGLYIFGSKLEMVWGPKRFLTFYLICGLGAGLISGVATLVETYPMLSDLNLLSHESTLQNFNVVYNKHAWFDSISMQEKYGINPPDYFKQLYLYMNSHPQDPANAKAIFNVGVQMREIVTIGSTVGASGCVYGLVAGAAYLFPNEELMIYFLFPLKMKWLALIYTGQEVWQALENRPQDQVAHVAHIGGALVGFLILYFSYRRGTGRKMF